ncbi:MAG: hypothetical protein ACTSQY_11750, partial [Candidatus Odinarchaeia archaeon]
MNNENFEKLEANIIEMKDLLESNLDDKTFSDLVKSKLFSIGDIIRVVDKPFISFCNRHRCTTWVDRILTTLGYIGFFWPEVYPSRKYFSLHTVLHIIDENKSVALEKLLKCNTYKKGLVSIKQDLPLGAIPAPPLYNFVIPTEEFNSFFLGLKVNNTMKESKSILTLKDIVLSKEQKAKV